MLIQINRVNTEYSFTGLVTQGIKLNNIGSIKPHLGGCNSLSDGLSGIITGGNQ